MVHFSVFRIKKISNWFILFFVFSNKFNTFSNKKKTHLKLNHPAPFTKHKANNGEQLASEWSE